MPRIETGLSIRTMFFNAMVIAMLWLVQSATTYATPVGMELQRRASWQAGFEGPKTGLPGVLVQQLEPDSPLARAGIAVGDRIIQVDHQSVITQENWFDLTDALVAGETYRLRVKRGAVAIAYDVQFNAVAREQYAGVLVDYGQIVNDYGIVQRTIVTRPENKSGKLPAVFVVQGLSCSSIEQTPGRQSNYIKTLTRLVERTGMVVYRVEKPGLGDSEGNCSETDFSEELNGYEVALQDLTALPYVDASRVLVYGASLGSALAPYLVNKYDLNGLIADGTFYKSWFEHMVEIERRIKQMSGDSDSSIQRHLNDVFIPLFYGILIEQRRFDQVAATRPLVRQAYPNGMTHLYGRPINYYQQLQAFNVSAEWEKLRKPVRIRWGRNDWIMSEQDNDLIVDLLKRNDHPDFQLVKQPGLDHWYTIHKHAADSFRGEAGVWDEKTADLLIEWIQSLNAKSH